MRALPVLLAALAVVLRFSDMGGMAEAQAREFGTTIFLNSHELERLETGDAVRYRFAPDTSDTYIFRSFPREDRPVPDTDVRLIRESDGQQLASVSQEGCFYIRQDLAEGEVYVLEVHARSAGVLVTEVMQEARGRCFDNPISLPGTSMRYAKTIVRPRDTHWFTFVAPVSGWYSIRTEKVGDTILDTRGYLMDAEGRAIAVNDDILFPGDANFMVQCELTAGETYYLRISAFSNETGPYRLVMVAPEEEKAFPELVTLSEHALMLDVDETHTLNAALRPADALPELVYASSDSGVVSVEPDGTLRAVAAGEATVWVFSYGGVRDRCSVTVRPVEVTGMYFEEEGVSLRKGERLQLTPLFEPANASIQTASYHSSDEQVVSVSNTGLLTGLSKGEATITAASTDGSFVAMVHVTVEGVRPVYRALVLGEYSYADGERTGGQNTAQGVADMLSGQTIDGFGYQVRLQTNSTRREVMEGISEAFAGAAETDVSLLYINCHGGYENGVAYLRLHDESRITAQQLEAALRNIQGKVVLLLDFCQSGAFISSETARSTFGSGKYVVLASADVWEDSYRRNFGSSDSEESTAAIMGRSLCEGAGWDLIYDRSVSLKADQDGDREITVQELFEYTRKRVSYYLKETGATQTVRLYPEGDQTVILGRS